MIIIGGGVFFSSCCSTSTSRPSTSKERSNTFLVIGHKQYKVLKVKKSSNNTVSKHDGNGDAAAEARTLRSYQGPEKERRGIQEQVLVRSEEEVEQQEDNNDDLSFIVISDQHLFTAFYNDDNPEKKQEVWDSSMEVLSFIKEQYGGDLVMMPGDSVSFGGQSNEDIKDRLNATMEMSMNEVVYTAGYTCYTTARQLYNAVGYDTILAAVGDHELGGNRGFRTGTKKSKIATIPSYRQAVADGYNKDAELNFLYTEKIGMAESRPLGTEYEETSYAYRYKNSLFITIDAFKTAIDNETNYIDRVNGLGGEGTITGDVDGPHLEWFENVLVEARKNETIRHIFVQAHLPILQPVRKVSTSGQFMDGAENSKFWKIMNQYGVDIYFAGDVHSSTASMAKDPNSTVVQIVSRGNPFNNFLHVYANDTVIDVTLLNEVGPKGKFNTNYTEYGRLKIDKSNLAQVHIEATGGLELVDPDSELIRFDFEEIVPLGTRQVFALNDEDNLMLRSVTIQGVVCTDSMLNTGTLGSQYDAQVGKLRIGTHRKRSEGGHAARFRKKSRFAMYGMGPFSGGEIVSFSMWIKPAFKAGNRREMVLFHYSNGSKPSKGKEGLTLTIAKGVPVLYFNPALKFEAVGINVVDKEWHQISVSMPYKSCLASEVQLIVDGTLVETKSKTGNDNNLFYMTNGRMSIGGLGYESKKFSAYYPSLGPYRGWLDDFRLVGRPLNPPSLE
jgi:Laminin G domain./Calcineurin-like phosphoesterase.